MLAAGAPCFFDEIPEHELGQSLACAFPIPALLGHQAEVSTQYHSCSLSRGN